MAFDRSVPAEADIARWFLDVPDPPPRTFEFALVLGGTVSAGAYTAGAVDFLIEALDCFAAAKRERRGAAARRRAQADHRHLRRRRERGDRRAGAGLRFPACRAAAPRVGAAGTGNPFYDIWVNTLRLDRFLDPSDIKGDVPLAAERRRRSTRAAPRSSGSSRAAAGAILGGLAAPGRSSP